MSTPDLAFEALALVGVVRGPVGVEVMLLLRLPQPLRAPLVLGPCTHVCYLTVHMYTLYTLTCGVLRSAPDWLWLLGWPRLEAEPSLLRAGELGADWLLSPGTLVRSYMGSVNSEQWCVVSAAMR